MARDELALLRKILPPSGFNLARSNGGHDIWKKGTLVLVLPAHGRHVTGELAHRIIAQARKVGIEI